MSLSSVATVLVSQNGKGWSSFNMIGQFFFLIFVLVFILYLAYVSTKFVAKAKMNSLRGRNIKVIESIFVGGQSSVQLIKVGSQFFLISVNKDSVNFLTEVEAENINEDVENETKDSKPFDKFLKDYIDRFKNKK